MNVHLLSLPLLQHRRLHRCQRDSRLARFKSLFAILLMTLLLFSLTPAVQADAASDPAAADVARLTAALNQQADPAGRLPLLLQRGGAYHGSSLFGKDKNSLTIRYVMQYVLLAEIL